MSILAGALSRRRNASLPATLVEQLKRSVSRVSEDAVAVYQDAQCCVVKVDVHAYQQPAFEMNAPASVDALAGEARLDTGDPLDVRTRTQDLQLLSASLRRSDSALLAKARGAFCAVHYEPSTGRLLLIIDKLGLRPLYYWADDRYVVFASALRIIESLDDVPRDVDLRGISETIAFGYPLGDRTAYSGVIRLRAAEIVEITSGQILRSQYWRWDEIPLSRDSEDSAPARVYAKFTDSVARLLRNDKTALAFLSGGLDSRCIVAALRERNVRVHTLNFSPGRSQDQALAEHFARAIEACHHEMALPSLVRDDPLPVLLRQAWGTTLQIETPPERPQLIWSGDGGSVGLGFVRATPAVEEHLAANNLAKAVDAYIQDQRAYVPVRLLSSRWRESLAAAPREGVWEDIADIRCKDPLRRFHLFLMLSDQRRHLDDCYEDIDIHRFEFHLPFFDSAFLEAVLSLPARWLLYHRFYSRWLNCFPSAVLSVPWQTYPGHEPCPLERPRDLGWQWDRDTARQRRIACGQRLLPQVRDMLKAKEWFPEVLDKNQLRLRYWAHRLALRDFNYAFEHARTLYRCLLASNGRCSLLPPRR